MIELRQPLQLLTPIGDATCLFITRGGPDEPARFLCVIDDSGEFWEFTQYDVRRMTCITEGRTKVTPFSAEQLERFRPMREAIERLSNAQTGRDRSSTGAAQKDKGQWTWKSAGSYVSTRSGRGQEAHLSRLGRHDRAKG